MQDTNQSEARNASYLADETWEQTLARWKRQEEEAQARAADTLTGIVARIHRECPHWKYLVAGYNGSGDEGCFEYVGFVQSEDEAESCHAWYAPESLIIEFPEGIDERNLEDLLSEFIPSGYEINEGGQGVVRIDIETGEVEIGHEFNVTETVSEPRSFQLDAVDDAV